MLLRIRSALTEGGLVCVALEVECKGITSRWLGEQEGIVWLTSGAAHGRLMPTVSRGLVV